MSLPGLSLSQPPMAVGSPHPRPARWTQHWPRSEVWGELLPATGECCPRHKASPEAPDQQRPPPKMIGNPSRKAGVLGPLCRSHPPRHLQGLHPSPPHTAHRTAPRGRTEPGDTQSCLLLGTGGSGHSFASTTGPLLGGLLCEYPTRDTCSQAPTGSLRLPPLIQVSLLESHSCTPKMTVVIPPQQPPSSPCSMRNMRSPSTRTPGLFWVKEPFEKLTRTVDTLS